MRTAIVTLLLIETIALSAQTKFPVTNLPVERNGINLINSFTGGLNAPQFSTIDLNRDGIDDLFVFDRVGDKVLTFLNDGSHSDTAFKYAPQYEKLFPAMTSWALIRDYNKDGVPDIFTYQAGELDSHGNHVTTGVKVYKGSIVAGNLHFDVVNYCLTYQNPPFTPNIFVNSIDIPAIVDVNNDGDLDILAFGSFGSEVDYYEGQIVEQHTAADSLVFGLATACWGNFSESASGMQVTLNVSCKGGDETGSPRDGRHVGAGLCPVYNHNNRDINLLLGGIGYDYMYMANNCGNSSFANICWVDTLWSNCGTTVHLPYFPTAYQIDADNDGFDDLLIAPNAVSSAADINNVLFYRNVQGDTCNYQYGNTDSFLTRTMMDFGTESKAAFFDYNSDGLMDMVVGNYGYFVQNHPYASRLALYRNVGSAMAPAYREVTTDYAGLSVYNSIQAMNPALADLDGDGHPDMLVGDALGRIHLFKNFGDTVAAFPVMTQMFYDSIDVGTYAAPFIFDINGDSLPDLVIGNGNGTLSYYWNFGSANNPLFSKDSVNSNFGAIDVTKPGDALGCSQPFIMRDSVGNLNLFVGSYRGTIFEYRIDNSALRNGSFMQLDSDFLHYNAGSKVTMQACDLNSDGKLEYLLGNSRGGLQLFSETVWDSASLLAVKEVSAIKNISIFPNPAQAQFTCTIKGLNFDHSGNLKVSLYNSVGQTIDVVIIQNDNGITVNAAQAPKGLYLVHIQFKGEVYSGKVIIQ